jgi:predicted nuclease of predicted toxin-antitoxin system
MKFKIDENLPVEIADLLKREGYDALTVSDQNLSGIADPEIISICNSEERALISEVFNRFISTLSGEPVTGNLWIVGENRIRIWK